MKIFVVGKSQSGKTTLAIALAQQLDLQHVAASGWVRRHFPPHADLDEMAAFSTETLCHRPRACLDDLQAHFDLSQPSVIEGIRNPFDFIHLFDSTQDLVIWLDYANHSLPVTRFEKGLEVIDSYLSWLSNNQLIDPLRVVKLTFTSFEEATKIALQIARRLYVSPQIVIANSSEARQRDRAVFDEGIAARLLPRKKALEIGSRSVSSKEELANSGEARQRDRVIFDEGIAARLLPRRKTLEIGSRSVSSKEELANSGEARQRDRAVFDEGIAARLLPRRKTLEIGSRSPHELPELPSNLRRSPHELPELSEDLYSMLHKNISPFKVYVKKEYLFDMDRSFEGELVEGTVFALSSYSGEALTFQILLHDGCLFSYMPIQALQRHDQPVESALTGKDLVFRNCPSAQIAVTQYQHLEGEIIGYFKNSNLWMNGQYILTIDWYEDNEQFHLVALQNGQYALLPNHKIKFKSTEPTFPAYKKLHQTWKVE